jgi:Leucine rich repeat
MATYEFRAARAKDSAHERLRLGTCWTKRCLKKIFKRCAVSPKVSAVSMFVSGLLLLGTFGSRAETYDYVAQGPDTTKSLPEPKDPASRERERQALTEFYDALGGPDWIERDFWRSNRPVGQWHGVTTDADGFVVTLTIYDNNVTGPLSPAICKLQRLQTLHLSFNKLSGQLPDGLGECRALKNLWVKGNKITGRLPDSVAQLPELEYLDIHANDMSGPLPTTWDTPKLRIFRADDNRISSSLPAQLLRQPRLEEIFLLNNDLTGTIPPPLSANLRALLLSNNKLSGLIPEEFGNLKRLTDLRLNRNQLSGQIPASLGNAAALQVLRLDNNRLVGPIPTGLGKRLMVFDASHNPGLEPAR